MQLLPRQHASASQQRGPHSMHNKHGNSFASQGSIFGCCVDQAGQQDEDGHDGQCPLHLTTALCPSLVPAPLWLYPPPPTHTHTTQDGEAPQDGAGGRGSGDGRGAGMDANGHGGPSRPHRDKVGGRARVLRGAVQGCACHAGGGGRARCMPVRMSCRSRRSEPCRGVCCSSAAPATMLFADEG